MRVPSPMRCNASPLPRCLVAVRVVTRSAPRPGTPSLRYALHCPITRYLVFLPDLMLLALGGLAGGFLVGLVGVGGGIVYAPVLLVSLQGRGISDPTLTPLVLGTSLFCVGFAAASGAMSLWRAGNVRARVAILSGLVASVALALAGSFVTTQPWYDRNAFQVVFGTFLLAVGAQMILSRGRREDEAEALAEREGAGAIAAAGGAAGALAAAAGVGGGVILVPLYHSVLRIPTRPAVGTSTAAIVIIAAAGALTYAILGWGEPVPRGAVGYVDLVSGLVLAVPAMVTARMGVALGRRLPTRGVRIAFGVVALVVAARLLMVALG